MSHVMGVNHSGALSQAEAMGSAMQMTNIARDIREDWMRGRVYLPRTWFEEMKVDASILKDPAQSHVSFALVRRLLAVADRRYQWGREGTLFLAPRAAVSIAVASYVYQGIGRKILRIGPEAINRRVYLTVAEKALAFFKGFWFVARQLPKRWGQPWVPVQIKEVWSPQ
jgi:phytoene synthase